MFELHRAQYKIWFEQLLHHIGLLKLNFLTPPCTNPHSKVSMSPLLAAGCPV